jgi:hypothetical protein
MPRKFQERDIFLAFVIEDANRAELFVADSYEFASRPAQLPVKRLHPPRRRVEMLLEKFFENVHQDAGPPSQNQSICSGITRRATARAKVEKGTSAIGPPRKPR